MKNRNIFSMVALSLLMVLGGIGCTTLQETTDGSYDDDRSIYRSSAFNDPFYSTATPVLVRDAYTGRYFYVYPANTFSPYDNYRYDNRNYNNRAYNNRIYSNPRTAQPQVSEEQRREQRQKLEDSRKRILGRQN